MKTNILVLALLLGLAGLVQAGGRSGGGWNVTVATGNATVIGGEGRRIFLKRIILSSATQAGESSYLMAFTTNPQANVNGSDASLFGGNLFIATAAIVPATVFLSTTSAGSVGTPDLNNMWSAGECDDCYIEIAPDRGLNIRKTIQATGGAGQAAVHWSY